MLAIYLEFYSTVFGSSIYLYELSYYFFRYCYFLLYRAIIALFLQIRGFLCKSNGCVSSHYVVIRVENIYMRSRNMYLFLDRCVRSTLRCHTFVRRKKGEENSFYCLIFFLSSSSTFIVIQIRLFGGIHSIVAMPTFAILGQFYGTSVRAVFRIEIV